MTRFPYDEFSKGFFESLLSPFGDVQTSYKISSEVREVDIYFTPSEQISSSTDLGLLSQCVLSAALRTGIIVLHQLPQTPATLWFRLLGKGKVQTTAIAEVAALPLADTYRQNALDLLGNLKVILETKESIEPEEQDLIMQLSPLYLEQLQAAEQVGEQGGEVIEAQALILRQLKRRLGNVSI